MVVSFEVAGGVVFNLQIEEKLKATPDLESMIRNTQIDADEETRPSLVRVIHTLTEHKLKMLHDPVKMKESNIFGGTETIIHYLYVWVEST